MDIQLIALIVIGVILLIIIGAFVFSSSFRKDVIASEGEASILGMFNVKGVLIILLMAIFCGTFIYVLQYENNGNKTDSKTEDKDINIEWVGLENVRKQILLDSVLLCEMTPLLGTSYIKNFTKLGEVNEINGINNFYYRLDSINYVNIANSRYRFMVSFGEGNRDGKIVWQETPKTIYKTNDAQITDQTQFFDISNPLWKKHYKVMMTLGQPDESLNYVEKAHLIVVSAEVDIQK